MKGLYELSFRNSARNCREGKYDGTVLGEFEGTTSLKSIEPRKESQVQNLRTKKGLADRPGSPLAANQEGGVTQAGTSLGENATPLRTRDSIISQNSGVVNTPADSWRILRIILTRSGRMG